MVRSSPRAFYVGVFGQYLLPFCALLVFKALNPAPAIAAGMILIASAPGGGIANYYSYLAGVNVALSVVITATSCFTAAVTMPLLLRAFEFVLEQHIDFHVPLGMLLGQLVLLMALPVSIGCLLRQYRPDFVAKYKQVLRRLGLLGLTVLIAFILIQTRQLFLDSWWGIARTATVFILLSMALGYGTGALFRLNNKDSFTLLIQCGVRNIAITTAAAVVILRRTEFATFAAIYFLIEAILILSAITLFRKRRPSS